MVTRISSRGTGSPGYMNELLPDGTYLSAANTLNDTFGNSLSYTSLVLKGILEYTRFIKPLASGGSSQSLDIIVVAKKPRLS